ncbi:hypothetical protein V5F38_01130 [Xanthobacter sp. V0B-10]|uniref:hypothetical protein n=1 Tax=Xanthobacter albus TaxID=3119929 RepID=UPI00372A92FA
MMGKYRISTPSTKKELRARWASYGAAQTARRLAEDKTARRKLQAIEFTRTRPQSANDWQAVRQVKIAKERR